MALIVTQVQKRDSAEASIPQPKQGYALGSERYDVQVFLGDFLTKLTGPKPYEVDDYIFQFIDRTGVYLCLSENVEKFERAANFYWERMTKDRTPNNLRVTLDEFIAENAGVLDGR